MEKPLSALDRHFQLPDIRRVDHGRPLAWLRLGWHDLRASLAASLAYGALFALAGYLILAYASAHPHLFSAAVSGFFLIGPIAAAGLYEIARQRENGRHIDFFDSLQGLRGHGDQLMFFGVFLAFVLLSWERLSAILFALFAHGEAVRASDFFRDLFLSGAHLDFVAAYVVFGGMLAAVIFTLSAVAIPMLMHRDCDIVTAMMTSARAVAGNIRAMALWALLIVVLVGIGFATYMLGMLVILPLLGHATWHAYRELIE
jgi:uncharacterized membrane protein